MIKGAEGYIAGTLAGDYATRTLSKTVVAWFVGAIVMVAGYFAVQVFMYGFGAARARRRLLDLHFLRLHYH